MEVSTVMYLAANDYIDIRAFIFRGASTNTYGGGTFNQFVVHRLS